MGALAAVAVDDEQHRQLRPALLRPAQTAMINPATGRITGGSRFNGIVLPGDGFEGEGNELVVAPAIRGCRPSSAASRAGSRRTHYNVFEPRVGLSYALDGKTVVRASTGVFHNRVTLNDATMLGGNPPFQPMVTDFEWQRRQSLRRWRRGNGSAVRDAGAGRRVQVPNLVHVVGGGAARNSIRLHRRSDLCRPARPLLAAGAQHQPAAGARHRQLHREHRGAAAVQGVWRHPPLRELRLLQVPQPAGQRRQALRQGAQSRRGVHARQVGGQREQQARRAVEHATTTRTSGDRPASIGGTCCRSTYIYDLPFWRDPANLARTSSAVGRSRARCSCARATRSPLPARTIAPASAMGASGSRWTSSATRCRVPTVSSRLARTTQLRLQPGGVRSGPGGCERFGTATRNNVFGPGSQQWDIALFKNISGSGDAQDAAADGNVQLHRTIRI